MVNGVITLSDSESFKYQIIEKYISGKIYREEAALLIKQSERTVSRLAKKVKERGFLGVKHGNFGKSSNRAISKEVKEEILRLKKEEYFDFNSAHFHDILISKYGFELSYNTLWKWLKNEKLVKNPRRKRRRKHVYRTRMPQEGLLLQMDGCHHKFNGKDDWVLISMIDDATSSIPYAEFFDGETTINCMKVLKKVIETKGVPKAIYTDKAGWAGGNKRTEFSQFQRACEKLGIQVIFANSPEAKGRIERFFRTIQDRLIPELRHNQMTDMNDANKYLQESFIPDYWEKNNTVSPTNPETAYSPLDPFIELDKVLCIEETRIISSDQTISYDGKKYVLEGNSMNLGRYEAVIRTDLNGNTKFYVMENEVTATELKDIEVNLEPIKKRKRFKNLCREKDADIIELFEVFGEEPVHLDYARMWRTLSELYGAMRDHKITGKSLKVKRPNKKIA
ncbi:MAG: ISNCY family transposase [Bdellovibrionota bacterium]|nr:ISNCY family transposase [Bdellovibrionota bacterium]